MAICEAHGGCELCGRAVKVGEWPWCPHGFGNNLQKPMEEVVDEHIDYEGTRSFTTIGEKVRFMDKNGIVPVDLKKSHGRGKLFFYA